LNDHVEMPIIRFYRPWIEIVLCEAIQAGAEFQPI